MQMQSAYWLEKVLEMISLYVSALLCTLQHIVIHAMQLSGVELHRVYDNMQLLRGERGCNCDDHILRMNCFLKHVIKGNICDGKTKKKT
jgi:hypothetical protein